MLDALDSWNKAKEIGNSETVQVIEATVIEADKID